MASIGAVTGEIRLVDAYSAALSKLDGQLTRMESRLTALTASSNTLTAATKRKAGAFDNLGTNIKNTLIHVGTAVVAYKGLAAAIGSVGKSVEFDRTLTKIVNLTSVSADEVARFKTELHGIRAATGRGPQELAEGFLAIASTGSGAVETTQRLTAAAQLAAVGLGDTNTIGRALSATINAYGRANISAAQASDQLLATVREGGAEATEIASVLGRVVGVANLMGISFAEVGASIATFTRLGVGADEAVTALRGTMMAMLNPSKGATDALAAMGMTMAELRQQVKDKGLATTLIDLVKATKGNVEAIADIIPNVRALAGVLANASSQGDEYRAILDRIKNSSGDLTDAMAELAKSPAMRWDALKAQFESLALTLGEKLLPGFEAMGVALTSIDPQDLANFGISATRALTALGEILTVVIKNIDLVKYAVLALIGVKFAAALEAWGKGLLVTAAGAKTATVSFTSLRVSVAAIGGAVAIAVAALLLLSEKAKQYSAQAQSDIDSIVAHAAVAGRALDIILNKGKGVTEQGYLEQNKALNSELARRAEIQKEIAEIEERQSVRQTGLNNIRLKALREELKTNQENINLHKGAIATIHQTAIATGQWAEDVNTLEYEWDDFWGGWVKKKEVAVTGLGDLSGATGTFNDRIQETIAALTDQQAVAKANLDLAIATQKARLSGGDVDAEVEISKQAEIQLRITRVINSLQTTKNRLSSEQLATITDIVTKTVEWERAAEDIEDLTKAIGVLLKQTAGFADDLADKLADAVDAAAESITDSTKFSGPFQISVLEKQLSLTREVVAAWASGGEMAARAVMVQQEALEHNVKLTDTQAAGIVRLQVEQEKLNYLIGRVAELSKPAWQTYIDAALSAIEGVVDALGNALSDFLHDGKVSWDSFWDDLKSSAISIFVDMLKEMLKRWLTQQAIMRATSAAGGGGMVSGGGGGWSGALMNMGMSYGLSGAAGGGAAGAGLGGSNAYVLGGSGSAGTSAMLGAGLAAYALFVVYKGFIEDHDRKFASATLGGSDGRVLSRASHGKKHLEGLAQAVDLVVQNLQGFLKSIDVMMNSFAQVTITKQGKGWYAAGGLFDSAEAAADAAIAFMTIYGEFSDTVSLLVRTAIRNTEEMSTAAIAANVEFARMIENIGKPQFELDIQAGFEAFLANWDRALTLFGSDLQAMGTAFSQLTLGFLSQLRDARNQLTGYQPSVEEQRQQAEANVNIFNAQVRLMEAELRLRAMELEARAAQLRAMGEITRGDIELGGARVDAEGRILYAKGQLLKAEGSLFEATLNLIDAQLTAIAAILAELPSLIISEEELQRILRGIRRASAGARRAGGGSDQDSIRREVEGFGLGSITTQLRDVGFWFTDLTKRIREAGYGAVETARLLALTEEERRRREGEIRLSVVENFQRLLGIGQDPFSQLRKGFEEAHEQIDEAGFGAARAANMHRRLNAALDEQLQVLSQQEFISIGDDLMSFVERYYGEIAGFDDVRIAMEELRFHLDLENMRARFQLLVAEGKLAADLVAKLGGVFDFIDANLPDFGEYVRRNRQTPGDSGGGGIDKLSKAADDAARAIEDLTRRFAAAKQGIADLIIEMAGGKHGVVTSRQAFEFQQSRWADTLALANTGEINALENIPDVGRDFLESLAKFSPSLLAVEFPKIQAELMRLMDISTAHEGNVFVDERFQTRHEEQIAVQQAGFGMIHAANQTQINQQAEMIASLSALVTSNQDLSNRLMLLEAQQAGLKRTAR